MERPREGDLGSTPSVNITINDLLEAGAHFGHKRMKWNPKMKKFIFGERNGYHIIDVRKTIPLLQKAYQFVYETARKGGTFLFVATKKNIKDVIRQFAEEVGAYYVTERWPGGLLTNFETTKQRLAYMRELEARFEEFEKGEGVFIKKEIVRMKKEYEKLKKKFGGVRGMDNLPDVLYVVDPVHEKLAVHEANILRIPIVAIVDTNADPDLIDYPIPANDDAIKSVKLITSVIVDAIRKGRESREALIGKEGEA